MSYVSKANKTHTQTNEILTLSSVNQFDTDRH